MSQPIRVLHEVGRMEAGGIQQLIMNIYRNIDRDKVQFDFMVYRADPWFEAEIKQLGGTIYPLDRNLGNSNFFNMIKKEWNKYKVLREHPYNIIHIHCGRPRPCHIAIIPWVCGVSHRIYHGHNMKRKLASKFEEVMLAIGRIGISISCNHFFACSRPAAKWNLSKIHYNANNYTILKNGIDTHKFSFNSTLRSQMREKLGVSDSLVLGHVGRFMPVKNHKFLLEILREVKYIHPKVVLLLVGDGPEYHNIQRMAQDMDLEKNIIFYGTCKQVEQLYQAMDVFLLPSFFEGFGIVGIEAQASGLPVIISDCIPSDVLVTEYTKALPLDDAKLWAKKIVEFSTLHREDQSEKIRKAGYDIYKTVSFLEQFYLTL
nr:glycosyltransferase [uncultured Butyricicoccus sp.]